MLHVIKTAAILGNEASSSSYAMVNCLLEIWCLKLFSDHTIPQRYLFLVKET